MKRIFLIVFGLISPLSAGAATSCESLSSLSLPNSTITLAETVAAGTFTPPGGTALKDLPAFCRVAATLKPTSESDIKVEVWLPAANWNGKYQAVGNGGWAGSITYSEMAQALRRGYATSSTDTGHTGGTGNFAINWEKYVDFAYRSEHEMAVKAKAIIDAFYGNAPKYSYWNGCSTGGRQGLMEAQRYPNDFDGIIAGSSANPKSYLNAWALSAAQMVVKNPAGYIPPSKYPLIHQAVINSCDSIDGLKDGLIDDPRMCRFDPKVLTCSGGDNESCLTVPQVELARKMQAPAKTKDGNEIFPGHTPGTELGWRIVFPEPGGAGAIAVDQYKYLVYKDEKWDWRTFDLEKDVALSDKVEKGIINAVNSDLTTFSGHGGKLIMYHGWNDPNVAAQSSINYQQSVAKKMGGETKISNWLRLFLAPGMGHCGGGEGPNTFDMVTALEQWVEKGKAPDRIIASHSTNGEIDRTRPLCPYPQVARYKGTSSIDDAANFECKVP